MERVIFVNKMNKSSIWSVLGSLFVILFVLMVVFVVGISAHFYQSDLQHVIERDRVMLELVSNVVAGPSWTVKESYPGTAENLFRGLLDWTEMKFIRLVDGKSNLIIASGNVEERGVVLENLPVFSREISVRDGEFENKPIKEFSLKARDGSNIFMGVSIEKEKEKAMKTAVMTGLIGLLIFAGVMVASFMIIRKIFIVPMVSIANGFGFLKNRDYSVRLDDANTKEVQNVFISFNEMVKKIEEAEAQLKEEIKRTKEIDRMKSEFISVAAHQLRTPLSAVKWTMKMLIDGDIGKLNEEQKTFLTQGYISNERIINLVNDLLNVARIEEGRFGYEFVPINIEDLIESVTRDFIHKITKKGINFTYNKSGLANPPNIKIDPSKLKMVIQNLIDNAVKYTPDGGKVTISVKFDKMEVGITIADTGMGIPREHQERLFTKFFRSNNAVKAQTEGTGLGLFIAKNIIEKHRGKVWFDSEEGKGTTFHVTIPLG